MKAWHVQDSQGEYQEIIFAEKRSEAIYKSEAMGWTEYINIRAKRAKYCDDLEKDTCAIIQAQIDNDWWIECHGNKCTNSVTMDDKYTIIDGYIYCKDCSKN